MFPWSIPFTMSFLRSFRPIVTSLIFMPLFHSQCLNYLFLLWLLIALIVLIILVILMIFNSVQRFSFLTLRLYEGCILLNVGFPLIYFHFILLFHLLSFTIGLVDFNRPIIMMIPFVIFVIFLLS